MLGKPSLAFAAAAALLFPAAAHANGPPPDIVIFLADDLSVKDIEPYGGTNIPTSNCEAVAKAGVTFDRAYAASPSCAPSRAALLTGLFPAHNGALFNHQKIRPDLRTWPSYFQSLGYEVVAIGKVSHYDHVKDYGFDYAAWFNYHQDVCVQKAVEWLKQRKSAKPLCLFVGTNWPHVPWPQRLAMELSRIELPAKIADTPETRKARARYSSAVENADRDLGMVWKAAHERLPRDTFFLFSADHGSQFPFAKWNLYEPGLHVPLIAVWPGHIQANTRTEAMVSWVDILPTLIEVAGAQPSKIAPNLDGRSFLPVLLGQAGKHRDAIFASHSGDGNMNFYPSRSARDERWKYIRNLDPQLEFHTHVDRASGDTGYWPSWIQEAKTNPSVAEIVEHYYHRPAEELYDLRSDPDELHNLAADASHAADLQRMRGLLDGWMKAMSDRGMATDTAARPNKAPKGIDP